MNDDLKKFSYVLITPARNEEDYIEKTINSVISQSILPKKWVIVDDGSTDQTDEIVNRYIPDNNWMELLRIPEHRDRSFAAKAHCFNAGYQKVKNIRFDIIGNLDADISFEQDYFEFLLRKFAETKELGVAGTPFVEDSFVKYNYDFTNIEHVSGACQLFRRECFEAIGGYKPVKGGGIDWIAVTTARMKGWKTRTFSEKTCYHHRKIGTGNNNLFMASFRQGSKDYYLGGHPIWQLFRACYQMKSRPYIVGGLLLLSGYAWACVSRVEKPVSQDLIDYHRGEQMRRLNNIFHKVLKLRDKE